MDQKNDAFRLATNLGPRQFHVMAKPTGSRCNLDCTYGYYLSKENLAKGPGAGPMSDEVLESFIQQYIEGVTGDEVVFSGLGGVPMLVGLEFFRKVVTLEKKHAKPGRKIHNDLPTNGPLVNEEGLAKALEHIQDATKHVSLGLRI